MQIDLLQAKQKALDQQPQPTAPESEVSLKDCAPVHFFSISVEIHSFYAILFLLQSSG